MQTDQLVGRPRPPVISDFKLDSTMEGFVPLFDVPYLPPVSVDFSNPWTEDPNLSVGSFDSCDPLMQEFAVSENTPWHVLNPFEPGFDLSSMLPSLYEFVGHLSCTTG